MFISTYRKYFNNIRIEEQSLGTHRMLSLRNCPSRLRNRIQGSQRAPLSPTATLIPACDIDFAQDHCQDHGQDFRQKPGTTNCLSLNVRVVKTLRRPPHQYLDIPCNTIEFWMTVWMYVNLQPQLSCPLTLDMQRTLISTRSMKLQYSKKELQGPYTHWNYLQSLILAVSSFSKGAGLNLVCI